MRRVGSYEAKTHLPPLLYEVARGETITITKRGGPVAILKPASEESGVQHSRTQLRCMPGILPSSIF